MQSYAVYDQTSSVIRCLCKHSTLIKNKIRLAFDIILFDIIALDSDKIPHERPLKIEKTLYLFITLLYLLRHVTTEMKMCTFTNVSDITVMYTFILLSSFSMFALVFFPVKMLITKKYEVLNVQYFNK